jgi:hypothetical protein
MMHGQKNIKLSKQCLCSVFDRMLVPSFQCHFMLLLSVPYFYFQCALVCYFKCTPIGFKFDTVVNQCAR